MRYHSRFVRAALMIILTAAGSACHERRSRPLEHPAMVVLPGAQDVRTANIYDGQVTYRILEPYPGEQSISEIRRRLAEMGWQPRDEDLLNPTLSRAITARWRRVQTDKEDVIAWAEQWQNAAGDVVIYGFSYRAPSSGADPDPGMPMEVLVSYFKGETARALERDNIKRDQ